MPSLHPTPRVSRPRYGSDARIHPHAQAILLSGIVGEIGASSVEQSSGEQQVVGEAVTSMDQATQQNAALVEESAAAAEGLRHQAGQLVEAVAVFRLSRDAAAATPRFAPAVTTATPAPATRAVPSAKSVKRTPRPAETRTKESPAVARPETEAWETF